MNESPDPQPTSARPRRLIPLWLKIVYTLFVLILVPAYTWHYGLGNFLWFSNVALLLGCLGVWLESRLILTMQAISVAIPETVWMVDFISGLLRGGTTLVGMVDYMFDPDNPLLIRLLSLYHIPLPILLVWLALRLAPDPRALWAQTLLAWVVLPASRYLADPARGVNWVYAPEDGFVPQMPGWMWVLALMIAFPLLVYLPTYLLLAWVHNRWMRPADPVPANTAPRG
jgi:hypothetical protein